MKKKDILELTNNFYVYHRSNSKVDNFKLINEINTVGGSKIKAYGVYFNFDKNLYKNKGKFLHSVALDIKNPYITEDQIYSAIITKDKKDELTKNGFDSVVLVSKGKIIELIAFKKSQIKISDIS